jgi:hypothetical protein
LKLEVVKVVGHKGQEKQEVCGGLGKWPCRSGEDVEVRGEGMAV